LSSPASTPVKILPTGACTDSTVTTSLVMEFRSRDRMPSCGLWSRSRSFSRSCSDSSLTWVRRPDGRPESAHGMCARKPDGRHRAASRPRGGFPAGEALSAHRVRVVQNAGWHHRQRRCVGVPGRKPEQRPADQPTRPGYRFAAPAVRWLSGYGRQSPAGPATAFQPIAERSVGPGRRPPPVRVRPGKDDRVRRNDNGVRTATRPRPRRSFGGQTGTGREGDGEVAGRCDS
jgi:hypothetical protein